MLNRQINLIRASRILYVLLTATILSLSTGVTAGITGIRGQGGDTTPPTVQVLVPAGGETLTAGTPFTIQFAGSDNDALSGFLVAYSTDGGMTFPNEIGRVGPMATSIIWNIPDGLQTTQGRIQVTARDRSGNTASAVSGIFTVRGQPPMPGDRITITFDPPPPGQCAPPRNVRAIVACRPNNLTDSRISPAATEVVGYNIYRVPAPPDGQLPPTPEQIVSDPKNLVGSIPASAPSFTDNVSTAKGSNFCYLIASFCSDGRQAPSQLGCIDLPVIKNPVFKKGTIFIDSAGSFIRMGALLIINDREAFPLQPDSTGVFLTVPKTAPSSPGGLKIKKVIKKGATVRLVVKNPDGKLSCGVSFTRPQK
jgi:hypothetical protein